MTHPHLTLIVVIHCIGIELLSYSFRIDGCCRHVAATLFEVLKFQQDYDVKSVTSGKCLWVARAKPASSSEAVEVHNLQISIMPNDNKEAQKQETAEIYDPVPESIAPVAAFFDVVKECKDDACILDTWEVRKKKKVDSPQLPCLTPSHKIDIFLTCHECAIDSVCNDDCYDELEGLLTYSDQE